jgi:trans-2-enoyl-CoA reductase
LDLTYKQEELMRWLEDNDSIPDILKKCVDMIPERYFYGSDIDSDIFKRKREDLNELLDKSRKPDCPKVIKDDLSFVQRDYFDSLSDMANTKRKLLLFGCQMQDLDKQVEMIIKLATDYHLEKSLLRYKEVYR